jgi:5'-nucleotidase
VSEDFTKRGYENWQHYRHIEVDSKMPYEEKLKHMEDWWIADMSDIANQKLTKDHFLTMTKTSKLHFRYGLSELLRLKQEYKFPMLVVSAGIGEIIKAAFEIYLEANGLTTEYLNPFNIVSNLGVYNDEDVLIDFNVPHVNIMNKDATVAAFVEAQKLKDEMKGHELRTNILMMGDIPEDVKMINSITYNN